MNAVEIDDLRWQKAGLCRGCDPEMFFVPTEAEAESARNICSRCAVKIPCLAYAIAHQERFGIWGGMTERQRRNLSPEDKVRLLSRAGRPAA